MLFETPKHLKTPKTSYRGVQQIIIGQVKQGQMFFFVISQAQNSGGHEIQAVQFPYTL